MPIHLPDNPMHIISEIVEVMPGDIHAIVKSLTVASWEYAPEGDKNIAWVTRDSRVVVNRQYCEEHCESLKEFACSIIHHEIIHDMMRHLGKHYKERFTPYEERLAATGQGDTIKNLVLDREISTLQMLLFSKGYMSFDTRLYPKTPEMPDGTLNPAFILNPEAKPRRRMDRLAIRVMNSEYSMSTEQLIEYILRMMETNARNGKTAQIVNMPGGAHICGDFGGPRSKGEDVYNSKTEERARALHSEVKKRTRRINLSARGSKRGSGKKSEIDQANQLFFGKEAGSGAGIFEALQLITEIIEEKKTVAALMQQVAEFSPEAKILKAVKSMIPKEPAMTRKWNSRDKNTRRMMAAGILPLLHLNPSKPDDKALCQVYFDTSGSQVHVVPKIASILSKLSEYLEPEVIGFDEHIFTIARGSFGKKELRMGGGTSFDSPISHMLGRFKRKGGRLLVSKTRSAPVRKNALMFTDGHAGLDEELIQEFKRNKCRLLVVFTENVHEKSPIMTIALEGISLEEAVA